MGLPCGNFLFTPVNPDVALEFDMSKNEYRLHWARDNIQDGEACVVLHESCLRRVLDAFCGEHL